MSGQTWMTHDPDAAAYWRGRGHIVQSTVTKVPGPGPRGVLTIPRWIIWAKKFAGPERIGAPMEPSAHEGGGVPGPRPTAHQSTAAAGATPAGSTEAPTTEPWVQTCPLRPSGDAKPGPTKADSGQSIGVSPTSTEVIR